MQARYDTSDLRTFQRDLKRVAPKAAQNLSRNLATVGRIGRDAARAEFESRFQSESGDALRSIKSSASGGRVSIFVDARTAKDAKGFPYPVALHQGWHPRGGANFVPGHPFLDEGFARAAPAIERGLESTLDIVMDELEGKTGI